jgi:Cu+-exporting ATPase
MLELISENVNVFSPACDGILEANEFQKLHYFKKYLKGNEND